MSVDNKIHIRMICDYNTIEQNQVYTRERNQFRIYNHCVHI
jgi:hypothetical protein